MAFRRVHAHGLSAAADASAGAGHHLDEVVGARPRGDLVEEDARVLERMRDRHPDLRAGEVHLGLLYALEPAHRLEVEGGQGRAVTIS